MTLRTSDQDFVNAKGYLERLPEKLVVEGYRRWMSGYETGDIQCWEMAWNLYAGSLGACQARALVAELSCWIRTIRAVSTRTMNHFPYGCGKLCRDECMALSMVAGVQHKDRAAMEAAATHLIGCHRIHDALEASCSFGMALDAIGQHLIRVPKPVVQDIALRPERQHFH
ncbi:hypothetical protein [Breoghania sp.]|uniref:hypothetical protein n=1 Tax=Breoghania sp. TaxID=2065378 RepID=UPI002AAB10DB|nr:hypothetical protein [Breoghania sp.]